MNLERPEERTETHLWRKTKQKPGIYMLEGRASSCGVVTADESEKMKGAAGNASIYGVVGDWHRRHQSMRPIGRWHGGTWVTKHLLTQREIFGDPG